MELENDGCLELFARLFYGMVLLIASLIIVF